MPKDGSHIGYSLFPGVRYDLRFVESFVSNVSCVSKIQLVVYYQCCVLIG